MERFKVLIKEEKIYVLKDILSKNKDNAYEIAQEILENDSLIDDKYLLYKRYTEKEIVPQSTLSHIFKKIQIRVTLEKKNLYFYQLCVNGDWEKFYPCEVKSLIVNIANRFNDKYKEIDSIWIDIDHWVFYGSDRKFREFCSIGDEILKYIQVSN